LPLAEPPVELLVAVEPLDVLDELEDEHAAAVRESSSTAVAPAAGFAKDRFIPAPLLLFLGSGQLLATSPKHTGR
jgi:hypothetical protein